MISAIAAAVLLAPQAPPADLTGSQVFSKMLERYHGASTVRGTIEMTQTAGSRGKVTIRTTVQSKKPNLFFLEQSRTPRSSDLSIPNIFQAVSDGKQMAYTVPPNMLPLMSDQKTTRIYEVAPEGIDGGLNAFCTMILDRDLAVALALYNAYEVQRVVSRLGNVGEPEEVTVAGQSALRIRAGYGMKFTDRPTVYIPILFYIDKQFNLLGIRREEGVLDGSTVIDVITEWTVRLEVNGQIDDNLFKVPIERQ